jgi:hypothetical protein
VGVLRTALLELAHGGDADPGQASSFGLKFEIRAILRGASGRQPDVVTVWMVSYGQDFPHFVTAFPRLVMFNLLDTVVFDRDLPEHGLRRGDLGAVVDLHAPDGLEVEFVLASGRTQALVSLRDTDVRAVGDADLIAVRDLKRTA